MKRFDTEETEYPYLESGLASKKYRLLGFTPRYGIYDYYPKDTYNVGVYYVFDSMEDVLDALKDTRKHRTKRKTTLCSFALSRLSRGRHSKRYLLVFLPMETTYFDLYNIKTVLDWINETVALEYSTVTDIPRLGEFCPLYTSLLSYLETKGIRQLPSDLRQVYQYIQNYLTYLRTKTRKTKARRK